MVNSERSARLSLVSDKMEMEALYIEQQIALLQTTIETCKVMETQGAPTKAREALEVIMIDLKSDLRSLNESIKSINIFI